MEPILEFKSKESESEESESEESKSEEFKNKKSESKETDYYMNLIANPNKIVLEKQKILSKLESKESKNEKLRKENKKLKKELIERNDILIINNKFLINFKNYLNQIIYWYINIPITESNKLEEITIPQIIDHYQKILDDYKNKKFYIINSFNIINREKGFILFINNYGCVYGFNIIRDKWDKIICCNLSKFHVSHLPKELSNYNIYYNVIEKVNINNNCYTQILNNYILNNFTFDYQSELSPNKIKLISKLPFNETYSQEIRILFLYLNFIYTNG